VGLPKKIDMTGQRYGKLVVIREGDRTTPSKKIYWLCKCDCGIEKEIIGDSLRKGTSTSCGCNKRLDLTGKKYGMLDVLERVSGANSRRTYWRCKCECGVVKNIIGSNLVNGTTKSCGCTRDGSNRVIDMSGEKYGRLKVLRFSHFDEFRNAIWECKCDCGKSTYTNGASMRAGTSQSCGCLHLERISGENNPLYNPNKTEEERLLGRYILGNQVDEWRKEVYKRDYWECQVCGKHGGDLIAHHLDGWNWCVEKRVDLDNGVTLCPNCHTEFHIKYGYGDNTKSQFLEFQTQKQLINLM
jgi:hypothetical protein